MILEESSLCIQGEQTMEEKQHKRRARYSGKYPKKFEEKYKEHDPEKYGDTVARVIEKYPCRYAYFHYGAGNSGFSQD